MYEIVVGRSPTDRQKLGLRGTIFLGRHYVTMGTSTSLSTSIYLDVIHSHVILVSGKRGSGKTFSLAVLAEEIAALDPVIKERLAVVIFDTMGVFWTMKYPNVKQEDLLRRWNLRPCALDILLWTPAGAVSSQRAAGIPVDFSFTLSCAELSSVDWCSVFDLSVVSDLGVALDRAVTCVRARSFTYDLSDLILAVEQDENIASSVRLGCANLLRSALSWGVFSSDATPLSQLVSGGRVSVLDLSCYADWHVKCLVVGLLTKRLMRERMAARKVEELADVASGHSYFSSTVDVGSQMPLVWLLLDEAHEFLSRDAPTPATDALVQVLREGRQPGVSLVLATQQPGEIHRDVITQTDIVLSHRLTARRDIEALNAMMHTYLSGDIEKYLHDLPRERGAAIILDDTAEKMYPLQVRPRLSWHGGDAPVALKTKGTAAEELGL